MPKRSIKNAKNGIKVLRNGRLVYFVVKTAPKPKESAKQPKKLRPATLLTKFGLSAFRSGR